MYNIGDIFYYDDEYIKRADYCNENELKIVEYGKDDNGKMRYTIAPLYTQEELDEIKREKELADLQSWFDEYDNQVKQYIRCQRLGIEFDKDINELDLQAQENAKRIKEIRELLNQ